MKLYKHAADVYLVLDQVQDYEETDTVLGVYRSLKSAKYALRYHRRYTYYQINLRSLQEANYGSTPRETVIQHWRGDQVIEQWTFSRNWLTNDGEWKYKNLREAKEERS